MSDERVSRHLADETGDTDPIETTERHVGWSLELVTPYVNDVAVDKQQPFPGGLAIEEKLVSIMRD